MRHSAEVFGSALSKLIDSLLHTTIDEHVAEAVLRGG